ncbi:restriction endonuclease [Pedosphaera parvula]|uniref:Restriction endonuclease n=1 Tax=Pedosphaera parvula (strain Ellin514) TaxID=320771 RepID=B9X9Z1_PEDPL|nr:restriction endonuclease [Pedosphaera parvula]EEF63332.1 restriction endonuclease [Pedosphaera parvula Ellin514]
MGRRRKREDDWIEPVAKLVGLVIIGAMFVPKVRQMLQGLALIAAGMGLVALLVWLIMRSRQREDARLNTRFFPSDGDSLAPNQLTTATQTSTLKASPTPPPPLTTKDLVEKLRTIDWFQFEKAIEVIYWKLGYQVTRRGGANPDGGIDLIIEKDGQQTAIQCKHWKSWNVNVRGIREFLGALTHAGIQRGIFITLRGYTGDAKQLAEQHSIEILNESDLSTLLDQTNARLDLDLLAIFNDTRKFCPKCEAEMVLRTAQKGCNTGGTFWGCSQFPRCRYILETST